MTSAADLQIEAIRAALASRSPELLPATGRGHASVVMLLRDDGTAPEVLFIVRAEHERDPWSGNIGFPGGRLNPDETPLQAAERETFEELGLELGPADLLGRLDDLYGANMPVLVSSFVYLLREQPELRPNHEIARAFWCPVPRLLEPARQRYQAFNFRGLERTHPVVELLAPGEPLLWGITYRLIRSFFAACGHGFGLPDQATALR